MPAMSNICSKCKHRDSLIAVNAKSLPNSELIISSTSSSAIDLKSENISRESQIEIKINKNDLKAHNDR